MKYKTLAEMRENHPVFFETKDLERRKRGDCLLVKNRLDDWDHSRGFVWKVFDFSKSPALCVFSSSYFGSCERVAEEVNEIGRDAYLEKRR